MYTELKGYMPCHNAKDVIEAIGYEAEHDMDNPCSSVFCAHGAGFVVDWDRVEDYMHLDSALPGADSIQSYGEQDDTGNPIAYYDRQEVGYAGQESGGHARISAGRREGQTADFIGQDEIEEIMNRTYGTKERKKQGWARTIRAGENADVQGSGRAESVSGEQSGYDRAGKGARDRMATPQEEYLLVDGYNIIFAWDSLKELAKDNLDSARGKLMDILSDFQGYRRMNLILVFDAYKVKGNIGSTERYHNIDVVYTKEAETADQYIEKVTHKIGRKHRVRVATSDGLEQLIIMGAGAIRVSARELQEEVMAAGEELRKMFLQDADRTAGDRNYLLEGASEDVAEYVRRVLER